MKTFYITGVSGVGKSSVSEMLNQKGISSFDIDSVKDLCHWINKETLEKSDWHSGLGNDWHEAHEWICNKEKLIHLISQHKDIVVIVGCASNQDEFLDLFDKVFLLNCTSETFLKRIDERTNNDFGKHRIEKERILNWYKDFESKLIKQGAIPIDTEEPLKLVVEKIIKNIKS